MGFGRFSWAACVCGLFLTIIYYIVGVGSEV